jgi:hypothetical protein
MTGKTFALSIVKLEQHWTRRMRKDALGIGIASFCDDRLLPSVGRSVL